MFCHSVCASTPGRAIATTGLIFAVEHSEQQARRVGAGVVHVDVRISLESDHNVRQTHHRVSHVAVQIKRKGERCRRRDCTYAFEQPAFTVVVVLNHHRAVQVEQDGVATPGDGFHNRIAHYAISGRVHRAARIRHRKERRLHHAAPRLCCVDERAHRSGRTFARGVRIGAKCGPARVAGAECGQRRRHRRKRIRFVVEAGNYDSHGRHFSANVGSRIAAMF